MDEVTRIAPRAPGSRAASSPSAAFRRWTTTPRSPTPASSISCSRTGASAGKGEDLESIYLDLTAEARRSPGRQRPGARSRRRSRALGLSGGFQMQVELTDGSYDFARLQEAGRRGRGRGQGRSGHPGGLHAVPRPGAADFRDGGSLPGRNAGRGGGRRVRHVAELPRLQLTSTSSPGSATTSWSSPRPTANTGSRRTTSSNYYVRSQSGQMVPLGTLADIKSTQGPALISLYNLFPTATINGSAAAAFSSGQGLEAMEEIADRDPRAGDGVRMDGHVLPGKAGRQLDLLHLRAGDSAGLFRPRRPVRKLDHAGRPSSWPCRWPCWARSARCAALGLANNIYVQIGLVLLIALSAKNGILIVEMAREGRAAGKSILDATVEAAHVRFRPILMTSFVFILGRAAAGAGQRRRRQRAQVARHRRRLGHARLDLPGRALRALVLCRAAAPRRTKERAKPPEPHLPEQKPEPVA